MILMENNTLLKGLDTSDWESYKSSLGKAVEAAEEFGVSDRTITSFAAKFGEFLNQNAHADLPENKAIQELWQAADKKEQHTLAKLMVKICKKSS
jgi:hypothetical protein